MICDRLKVAVSGLERDFAGRVVGRNVDTHDPEGRAAVREMGWQAHGILIRGPDGRVRWSRPDHEVNMDDVRRAVQELLGPG